MKIFRTTVTSFRTQMVKYQGHEVPVVKQNLDIAGTARPLAIGCVHLVTTRNKD